jgi:hypothetical protein
MSLKTGIKRMELKNFFAWKLSNTYDMSIPTMLVRPNKTALPYMD